MSKENDYELNISFAEKYEVFPEVYSDVPVNSFPFSVRVINRFMNNGITSMKLLLETTPLALMAIKGFGRNCLDEVEDVCSNIGKKADVSDKNTEIVVNDKAFLPYAESIALGDFSFADNLDLSLNEKDTLERYKEGFVVLGEDFAFDCVASPEKVLPIIEMLDKYQRDMRRYFEAKKLVESLPPTRRNNRAYSYIQAFTLDDISRGTLQAMCKTENTTLEGMVITAELQKDQNYALFLKFLRWCDFNLEKEIEELFDKLYANKRSKYVIQCRAKKDTLEQIGSELGITRERVRQIEGKTKRMFSRYQSRLRIISKISAERNGDLILSPDEIEEYSGPNAQELIFLLQSFDSANYTYDQQLDLFVLGNDTAYERVNQYIESLPNIVRVNQLPEILKTASKDDNIPSEMLEKAFMDSYHITGKLYHRHRLTLASIYENVLDKHYPDGLKIYDTNEISKFRAIIASEYGDVGLPPNDRALAARIASICILCGRGVYKLKQKQYISNDLAAKIHKYIIEGDSPIFMTNTLYSVFEDDLNAAGITNKYYLQGVLHEIFAEEFTFRRDYVSKDANVTSVYSSIVDYIKRSEYPVAKTQIQMAFPGVTEIVINFATSDPEILNYFGEYLHASRLKLSESEKGYLKDRLSKLLCDGQSHHSKDIYETIISEKPEILSRNAAKYQYSAYSILEYLFKDVFQFSRPYIALNGVDIGRPAERLHDLIYSVDEFDISEISEFTKENHYQIQSLLEYVNGCNDEYLLINKSTMMRISDTGITKEIAKDVDALLSEEINVTMPIRELSAWNKLPKINVPWTEWLVFSVINKWGQRVTVSTSSNQFRTAVPLIAPTGQMDITAFSNLAPNRQDDSIKIDDLDDIDSLIEDIIAEDIWKENT